ncbi:CvpA family protein [Chloroflexales bacterium ZM16-3]|nr:CvpA family protein [Chloroflexales bacterium ZM16-3]
MNFIDILFILLFIGSLAVGFFQGMIRLAVLILALYLSLVLASLYYTAMGEWLVSHFSTQRFVGQYVGFAIVFFFGFLLLAAAGLYTFRYARLPGGLVYLDHIGGVVLGMLLGVFFIGTFAALLYNLMIARGGSSIDFPVMRTLGGAVANSFLLRYFAGDLLTLTYSILDPVLPEGARLIFLAQ